MTASRSGKNIKTLAEVLWSQGAIWNQPFMHESEICVLLFAHSDLICCFVCLSSSFSTTLKSSLNTKPWHTRTDFLNWLFKVGTTFVVTFYLQLSSQTFPKASFESSFTASSFTRLFFWLSSHLSVFPLSVYCVVMTASNVIIIMITWPCSSTISGLYFTSNPKRERLKMVMSDVWNR